MYNNKRKAIHIEWAFFVQIKYTKIGFEREIIRIMSIVLSHF